MLDKPVAPSKKRIVALGLIGGLIVGCFAALIRERKSGLVFSEEELQSLLPFPLLKHLPSKAQNTWIDALDLLASGPLSDVSGTSPVALIPLGKIPSDQLQAFSSELERALKGRELLVSNDLRETSRCGTQLLLTGPGIAKRTEISQFCQKLALQGAPMSGWVFLDPESDLG